MIKKLRQKFKYPENRKSFEDEIKSIFHHFYKAFIEVNKKKNFSWGDESPTLILEFFFLTKLRSLEVY